MTTVTDLFQREVRGLSADEILTLLAELAGLRAKLEAELVRVAVLRPAPAAVEAPSRALSTREAAAMLGVSRRSLARGRFDRFRLPDTRGRYSEARIQAWLRDPTTAPPAAPSRLGRVPRIGRPPTIA